jgi:hypothetical protein
MGGRAVRSSSRKSNTTLAYRWSKSKSSQTESTTCNSPGLLEQQLATIEWNGGNSRNGSSRSRTLVGLSRAFRLFPMSAVKSCSIRTSKRASAPRCFQPRLPPLTKAGAKCQHPDVGPPLERRASHPLLCVICFFDSFPMSTQFPRAIGDLVWTAARIPPCLPE